MAILSTERAPRLTLSEDAIDDILYLARVNETAELEQFLEELATQHGVGKGEVLNAAADEYSSNTAVHYAAANGHLETLTSLLAHLPAASPLINATNSSGNTALHWASLNGHLEIVKILVEKGADVTVINKAGHDAVFEAEINDKKEVVEWLLGHVAELEKGVAGAAGESEGAGDADGEDEMEVTMSAGDTSGEVEEVRIGVEGVGIGKGKERADG